MENKELEKLIDEVLDIYPDKVNNYKLGKTGLLGLFVGEVMKRSDNKADSKITTRLIRLKLGEKIEVTERIIKREILRDEETGLYTATSSEVRVIVSDLDLNKVNELFEEAARLAVIVEGLMTCVVIIPKFE